MVLRINSTRNAGVRREIALGFASCYSTPFLPALLVLLTPNTTETVLVLLHLQICKPEVVTPCAYALAELSNCFCLSLSVSLSVNNIEIPFKEVT